MTYRNTSSYLKSSKGPTNKGTLLRNSDKFINYILSSEKKKRHLQDSPVITKSQDVYSSFD